MVRWKWCYFLTKDNLIRRNWLGSPSCYFCSEDETIEHLYFTCPIARVIWGVIGASLGACNTPNSLSQYKNWIQRWLPNGGSIHIFGLASICWAIWKRRNDACFNNKALRSPFEVLTYACALMTFWAGLYGSEMQGKILEGVKALLSCVQWSASQQRRSPPKILLKLAQEQAPEEETSEDEV